MERPAMVATGIPQLDTILGGGIVERSLLVFAGPPGSGKTVLASQIMSAAVDRGERVLLVTAFSEPQAKLIAHLQGFRFFRSETIGERIKLLTLQHPLFTSLEQAAAALVREAREHRATMVVLDGLGSVILSSSDQLAPYRFLYDLSAKFGLLGINMLLTYDLAPGAEVHTTALTAVDSLVTLAQECASGSVRTLRVVKHRGAAPLLGYHRFRIDSDGVHCFPLLEALARHGDVEVGESRAAFGLPALDTAMGGGPNHVTSTLLRGPAGATKPLALRWLLHGLQAGERAYAVSLREPTRRILAGDAALGVQLREAASEGRLLLRAYHPAELLPDQLAHELLGHLEQGRRWRVLIDGAGEFAPFLAAEGRGRRFWVALLAELRAHGATTLVLDDRGREATAELSKLPDNRLLVGLSHAGAQVRVREMRFSQFDRQPVAVDA